ncbi:hypothetical protein [Fodinibius sediminis]|uniref:Alginate export n=1 Tax=Fodinibius sediminis TaxID=1214077 RepID=A0A521BZ87_9BACT|nr:hypothetical protein [Fodinibius sediminis]SMO51881.1 hypothetical protein SAMN06265218_104161 [Fodinibius sediminis]
MITHDTNHIDPLHRISAGNRSRRPTAEHCVHRLWHGSLNVLRCLAVIVVLWQQPVIAQEKNVDVDLSGYLKELGQLALDNNLATVRYNNIIHHRLETDWSLSRHFSFQLDMRNRLMNGYNVLYQPGYDRLLEKDQGYLDLSWVPIHTSRTLLHTQIDRMHLTYQDGDYEAALGRQRLNWAKTFVWSPNDLFNNFAYLDFDYEERPGTDALSFQYSWDFASSIHIAFQFADRSKDLVAAIMLREHWQTYDWQFIAGQYHNQLALGGGWAGYIGDAGFKGEIAYFQPEAPLFRTAGRFSATTAFDYMLSNGLYLQAELLYNGGHDTTSDPFSSLVRPPSADNLFIARSGIFLNGSYQLHPLVSGSMGVISSVDKSLFIFLPQLTFSIAEDLDFLILSQLLKGGLFSDNIATPNLLFMRLKWSY